MFTFDGIPMPYAKDQSQSQESQSQCQRNEPKPQPDWPGLISPMSVLDNVENFVIDAAIVVLLLSLKQSQVPVLATCYLLMPESSSSDQITRAKADRGCLNFDSLELTASSLDPLTLISPGSIQLITVQNVW